jgi:NADH-quinone oxidoreductase subunit A
LRAVSGFLRSYLTVLIFAGAAGLLVGAILGLSRLLQPRRPTRDKLMNYESGVDPTGQGWSQSQIRYYVFALLFVMFDVEAVFIFPWAVQVDALAAFGLVEMVVFVLILAMGLAYAWRKGVLRWV